MDRTWAVFADEDGDLDREELAAAFLELEVILHRLGGAVSAVAARTEAEDGEYIPSGVVFRWESFSPAQRRPREQAPVEVVEDPDAELAETA